MSLSACNPDRGPEYTTPAEFGEVTVSPQTMAFDSEVRVKVSVSCPYGRATSAFSTCSTATNPT